MRVASCYSAAGYKAPDPSFRDQKNPKPFVINPPSANFDETDTPNSQKTALHIKESQLLLETMKCEKNRLESFRGKWPLLFMNIEDLVKFGFFYLQSDDKVQCAFCGVVLHSWKIGDNPLKEHIKSFPRCPSLLKPENKTLSREPHSLGCLSEYSPRPTSTNLSKPKNPKMVDVKFRLSTFKNWPHPMISAQKLAYCGLYYTGVSDVVACFYCGVNLANWEPTDDPLTEHSKFYPNCNYLRIIAVNPISKGQTAFSNAAQSSRNSSSNQGVLLSGIVKRAKEIFPSSLVEKVIIRSQQQGQSFSSLHRLIEKILEFEVEENKTRSSTGKGSYAVQQSTNGQFLTGKEVGHCSQSDLLLCKICMDKERQVVFQPCGHLISCEKCADQVSKCPLCRKNIENRVRTFLS